MSASPFASILHVDIDAFYVSMELIRRPELRGMPVIVSGGLGPRSVVSTCSYEARAFGVRSAIPLSRARTLCPSAVVLPADFSFYAPASRKFHGILQDFSPIVEMAGADEAYLDLAGTERLWGPPEAAADLIRRRVRQEVGITASIGVATNKLVAKVASDAAKPDGVLVVPPGTEAAFLSPRPLHELPLIGPKTAERLARMGISTLGELAAMPDQSLSAALGPHGRYLRLRAAGQSSALVIGVHAAARSVSREHTFATDESDPRRLRSLLLGQSDRVATDLLRKSQAARTVTLKVRFPPFETVTRSTSGRTPFTTTESIFAEAWRLFEQAWRDHDRRPIRLLGVGATALQERARQLAFGDSAASEELASALEAVRVRFGRSAIRRAAELERGERM